MTLDGAFSLNQGQTTLSRKHVRGWGCVGVNCERRGVNQWSPIERASSRLFRGKCSDAGRTCHHRCIDIFGSYHKCACNHGYKLLSNKRSCWKVRSRTRTKPAAIGRYNTSQRKKLSQHGVAPRTLLGTRTRKSSAAKIVLPRRFQKNREASYKAIKRPEISRGNSRSYRNSTLITPRSDRYGHHRVLSRPGASSVVTGQKHSMSTSSKKFHTVSIVRPKTGHASNIGNTKVSNSRTLRNKPSLLLGGKSSLHKYRASRLSRYRIWTRNRKRLRANAKVPPTISSNQKRQITNVSNIVSAVELKKNSKGESYNSTIDLRENKLTEENSTRTKHVIIQRRNVKNGENLGDRQVVDQKLRNQTPTTPMFMSLFQADEARSDSEKIQPNENESKAISTRPFSYSSKHSSKLSATASSVGDGTSQNIVSEPLIAQPLSTTTGNGVTEHNRIKFSKLSSDFELSETTTSQAQQMSTETTTKPKDNKRTSKAQNTSMLSKRDTTKEEIVKFETDAKIDPVDKMSETIIDPREIKSQSAAPAGLGQRHVDLEPSKSSIRQKKLSSMQQHYLNPRIAALLRRLRHERNYHRRMKSVSNMALPKTSSLSTPVLPNLQQQPLSTTPESYLTTNLDPTPPLYNPNMTTVVSTPSTNQTNRVKGGSEGRNYFHGSIFDMAINHRHMSSALESRPQTDKGLQENQQGQFIAQRVSGDSKHAPLVSQSDGLAGLAAKQPSFPTARPMSFYSHLGSRPDIASEASHTSPKFFCPEGQRVFLTPMGNVCVPNSHRSNDTPKFSKIFPWHLCPQGLVPQTTNLGVSCNLPKELLRNTRKPQKSGIITRASTRAPIQFEKTMESSGVESTAEFKYKTSTETSKAPASFLMTSKFSAPIRSPLAQTSFNTMADPVTLSYAPCTRGTSTDISALSNGKLSESIGLQACKLCPPGQVVINTPGGKRCGFKSQDWLESLGRPECAPLELRIETEKGAECVQFEAVSEGYNPCSHGLELAKIGNRLECVYPDLTTTRPTSNTSPSGLSPPGPGKPCVGLGEMLVQTETEFSCRPVEETVLDLPACETEDEVFVKTKLGFECIRKEYTTLVCEDGFLLARDQNGFICSKMVAEIQASSDPESAANAVCRKGEVLVVEGGVNYCKRLEHNAHLCGTGFKPKPTSVDGSFVCAPEKINVLACPEGYAKTKSGTECLPIAPHTNLCKDQKFQELFGQQVDCKSGNLSAILVPCEKGYEMSATPEGNGDVGPMCRLTDYVNIICEEEKSCYTEPQRKSCGDEDKGGNSPCQALLRQVITGCQPQCANGGSCQGDVCICPPGLKGLACEADIDECATMEHGHCQHGCVNTFGSFQCECPFGFTLNSDKRSCKTIDCIPDCLNGGTCVDGVCLCPEGLQGDRCQSDINECQTGSHECQEACRNTFGGYRCVCGLLTQLGADGKSCHPRSDSCLIECRNGGKCENHHCACPPGFYGIACQLDVNECLDYDHGCSHSCLNTRGSYWCVCPTGMALLPDMKTCREITPT